MSYIIDTGWVKKTEGQTSVINVPGKVISATIQWRGLKTTDDGIAGPNTDSEYHYSQGTESKNLSWPTPPSDSTITDKRGKVSIDAWTGSGNWQGCCGSYCVSGSSVPDGDYKNVWFYPSSSSCPFSAKYENGSGEWYHEFETYTYWEKDYYTTGPTVTVGEETIQHSGELGSGETSPVYDLPEAEFTEFGDTTLTHTFSGGNSNERQADVKIIIEYAEKPGVITNDAENVGPYSVTLSGNITSTGNAETTRYVRYKKDGAAEWETVNAGVGGVGKYSANIYDLEVTETYLFQAYATNTAGTTYGTEKSFETEATFPSVATRAATDVSYITATLNGELNDNGGAETTVYFEYGKTTEYELGSINKGILVSGTYSHDLTGIDFDKTYYYRAYAINAVDRVNGEQRTFTTLYPYLPAPTDRDPESSYKTQDQTPTFTFTLTGGTMEEINPADKYHARLRLSQYVGMEPLIQEIESKDSQTGWEAYIGEEWVAFPSEGVDPGTIIRITPPDNLTYGPVYWDCASWDGERYGTNAGARVIRILLNVDGYYTLVVDSVEWDVYNDIQVIEASNGEMGMIKFSLSNSDGEANTIDYGDSVILALRDWRNNTEEFVGRVRKKTPDGDVMTITAILGDGFLGERRIKTNYPTSATAESITALDDGGANGVEVTSAGHGLSTDDKVLIENAEDYNGIYTVTVIDVDSYYIDTDYDSGYSIGGSETGKLIEDIGVYVKAMIETYCAPLTADDYVDTNTGFIAPINSEDKMAVEVMEKLRRNYGMYYFVDKDNEVHFYKPSAVVEPEATVRLRRGDP